MSSTQQQIKVSITGDASGIKSASKEASQGLEGFREKADEVDTKAMGFRDTLTGLQDGFAGIKGVMKDGFSLENLLLLGFGIGDLASGFYNLLIPALSKSVTWFRATTIGQYAAAAATNVWNVAQKALTLSFWLSPIGIIIGLIVLLVAAVVLIATKTDWFQRLWKAAWGGIKAAASAVGNWFKNTLVPWISGAWNSIISKGTGVVNWFKGLPGRIKNAMGTVANIITAPYRAGFNAIARAWNNTVGRLSFTVPSWVPGLGGNGFSMPNLPTFARGGHITGPSIVGENGPELFMPGANGQIIPNNQLGGSGEGNTFIFDIDLGEGITKRFIKHDRDLKFNSLAFAGR